MKIGFDLAQYSIARAGCGWYACGLLDAMARIAPEDEFLAYRHFGQWFDTSGALGSLPDYRNVTDPLAGATLEQAMQAWEQLRAAHHPPGEPGLIHSTSYQAPRFASAKLVVTIYDLSFWVHPEFTTDRIRLDCQRGVLDALVHADGLIFISRHAQQEFHRLLPSFQPRKPVLECVTPLASRLPPPPAAAPTEGKYWLSVGSLEPRKNISTLLAAYQLYAESRPDPRPLWLAGPAGWKNEAIAAQLRSLEARGLVRRLGYVPDDELTQLYRNATALLYPSWYEGFGLPVLEAMSQGCPVICSNRASLPDVAGDAALYVDPADPRGLLGAMLHIERDPAARAGAIQRGLVQATRFSWEKTAAATLAFYRRVLLGI
jgi:glycosyltransferase involved in cell wall biosynthesis